MGQGMSRAEGFEEMPAGKAENAVYFQSFPAAIEEHRGCFGIILCKTAQTPEHFPVNSGAVFYLQGQELAGAVQDKIHLKRKARDGREREA